MVGDKENGTSQAGMVKPKQVGCWMYCGRCEKYVRVEVDLSNVKLSCSECGMVLLDATKHPCYGCGTACDKFMGVNIGIAQDCQTHGYYRHSKNQGAK